MIKSMTGFGARAVTLKSFGKISVEIRASNHKFLETILHLPEGLLSLEEQLKKEIESKIKRGRITCVVNFMGAKSSRVFINMPLLKNYIIALRAIKKQFHLKDDLSIDTLSSLPGILSLGEDKMPDKTGIASHLKTLVREAMEELIKTRQKEGRATYIYLNKRADLLKKSLEVIKKRFKKAVGDKLNSIKLDDERASFLKNTDITEEMERLTFHIRNLKSRLTKDGPVGKELDFIAQEMQREANTTAAKSFDAFVSGHIVQVKSEIEKIREQVQNIE